MHLTLINDCSCENALGRQVARAALLTDASVYPIGVSAYDSLAAGGNLIDALDAHEGRMSGVLVNVAPRHGEGKQWENGTPFCYFVHGSTVVVATVGGYTLSLVRKLGIVEKVSVVDIHSVLKKMAWEHIIDQEQLAAVSETQFRSYDFAPRLLSYLLHGNEAPATLATFDDLGVSLPPHAVWHIDNFGNVKTTLLPDEVGFAHGKRILLSTGEFMCYEHLSDVPDGEAGIIVGSSGIGPHRFLEIVVQGGRANEFLNIALGDEVLAQDVLEEKEPKEKELVL